MGARRSSAAASSSTRSTASLQLGVAQTTGGNLDATVLSPITGGASQINIYGAVEGANVYRPNALTGDPNHLAIELLVPLLVLLPIYLRLERGHRLRVPLMLTLMLLFLIELATFSRSGMLGLLCRPARARRPLPAPVLARRASSRRSASSSLRARLRRPARRASSRRCSSRASTRAARGPRRTSSVYEFIPQVLSQHPLFGLGLNNFSVYYEFVTGRNNFGPHSFYVALFVESGIVGALLFVAFLGYLFHRLSVGRAIGRAPAGGRRRARGPRAAAGVGLTAALVGDDGLELLLPDDELLLLLRPRDARDRGAGRLRAPAAPDVKVCVLTTSYPRHPGDVAGGFVAGCRRAPARGRRRGRRRLARDLPALRHRVRRRDRQQPPGAAVAGAPAAALPALVRAGRPPGSPWGGHRARPLAALGGGGARDRKPLVAAGVGLGRRAREAPAVALPAAPPAGPDRRLRLVLARRRRARARRARRARDPERRRRAGRGRCRPSEPPHVLYVGRLSEEKGVRELAEAAAGLPLVVVGDGPLRDLLRARRLRPARRARPLLRARGGRLRPVAARGVRLQRAREAMAHGRAVVTTGVGGLADAIEDGVTGVVVAGRDARRCGPRSRRSSPTPRVARGSARLPARRRRRASRSPAATAATLALYREL